MSKATFQAKFGGKRLAQGGCSSIPTPKKLEEFVKNSSQNANVSARIKEEQQTR